MQLELLWNQPVRREGGDVLLLEIGVAGQFDDVHSILERGGNCDARVRCRDEHDIGKIEGDIKIVVPECGVLFRIQHFKQC